MMNPVKDEAAAIIPHQPLRGGLPTPASFEKVGEFSMPNFVRDEIVIKVDSHSSDLFNRFSR
jgi:hypothetical protein